MTFQIYATKNAKKNLDTKDTKDTKEEQDNN